MLDGGKVRHQLRASLPETVDELLGFINFEFLFWAFWEMKSIWCSDRFKATAIRYSPSAGKGCRCEAVYC